MRFVEYVGTLHILIRMTTVETATVNLQGRDITVKLPTETQFALLAQQARGAASGDRHRAVKALAIIMDIIENLIDEADRDYVTDLMSAGNVDAKEILGLLEAFKGEETASARPAPVRRARR